MKNFFTKQWDLCFGAAGTAGTFTLANVSQFFACIAGGITVAILLLRLRREWLNRNTPPDER